MALCFLKIFSGIIRQNSLTRLLNHALLFLFFNFFLMTDLKNHPFRKTRSLLRVLALVGGLALLMATSFLVFSAEPNSEENIFPLSGNVGIGTTSPGYKLDVAGDANVGKKDARHYLEIASQEWPEIKFTTPSQTAGMRIGMAHADNSTYGVADGDMYVYSSSLDRMGVVVQRAGDVSLAPKGGNVGIGTTSPGYKLDVAGDANVGKLDARHYLEIASQEWPEIKFTTPSQTAGMKIGMAHADNATYGVADGDMYVYSSSLDRMGVVVQRAGDVSLAPKGGKVGIGTTSPGYKLDVAGDANVGKKDARHYLEIASQEWPEIRFTTPSHPADMRIGMAHADNSTFGVTNGDMYVYSPGVNRMGVVVQRAGDVSLVPKGGKVGIGTTSPSEKLEVVGTVKATAFVGDGSGLTGIAGGGDGSYDSSASSPEDAVYVNDIGKVGIGTTSPTVQLDVAGDANVGKEDARHYLEIASQEWPEIRFTTPSHPADMRIGMAHADNSTFGVTNGDMYVYSPGVNRMGVVVQRAGDVSLVPKGGKVGIGTTSPVTQLEVAGGLKLGNDASTCDAAHTGTLKYAAEILYLCNGRDWRVLQDVAPEAQLTFTPEHQNGMDVTQAQNPGAYVTFTLMNNGRADSETLTTTLSNPTNFALGTNTCAGQTLARGATCTIKVRPKATTDGAFTGDLQIESNNHPSARLAGTASGFELYTFSSHTFTNCGQTGRTGPSTYQCRSAYAPGWADNNAYFTTSSGIQHWTVPETGSYTIEVWGAAGGIQPRYNSGGRGAGMRGDFGLQKGQKLYILIGQKGGNASYNYGAGGGGGSYVFRGPGIDNPLIIAGGGGGDGGDMSPGDGSATTAQRPPAYFGFLSPAAKEIGNGETAGAGLQGTPTSQQGFPYGNGGFGEYSGDGNGGFGGGGGGADAEFGGGGGGYTGGNSGKNDNIYHDSGQGGGSYNAGTNYINTAGTNSGHGKVIITKQ